MLDWPFVGRDHELAAIAAGYAVGEAAVVVSGVRGAGKTRLAREAMDRFVARGGRVEWVNGTRSAASIQFGAVAHLLGGHPVETGRLALMRSIATTVAAWGGTDRPVLGIDDAHLLDEASAAAIGHLAACGVAFLLITVADEQPVPDAIAALRERRHVTMLDLPALPAEAIDELLDHALPGGVDGSSRRRLHGVAGGNPLVLSEVLRASVAKETLRQRYGVWRLDGRCHGTLRIADLLAGRLRGMEPETRLVLELVACGDPVPLAMLERLCGTAPIVAAERGGLVVVEWEGARAQARLAYPLHGELVQAILPVSQARQRWRLLAKAAMAGPLRRCDDALRAAQWQVASGSISHPKVVLAGARQAVDRADLAQAERLARAARSAALGEAADEVLARVLVYRGRGGEAADVLAAARARTATITRAELLYWGAGEVQGAERALDRAAGGADGDLADGVRAWILLFDGRCADALAAARRVLGRPGAAPEAAIWAAAGGTAAAGLQGLRDEAMAMYARGRAVARGGRGDLPWDELKLGCGGCLAHLGLGDLDRARMLADEGYQAAVGQAEVVAASWAGLRGLVEVTRGRYDLADAPLREAIAVLDDNDSFRLVRWFLGGLAGASALAGDARAARSWLDRLARRNGPAPRLFTPWIERWRAWTLAAEAATSKAVAAARRVAQWSEGVPTQEALALYDIARFGGHPDLGRLDRLTAKVGTRLTAATAQAAHGLAAGDGSALAAAADTFAALGHELLAAEARAAAARAFRRTGQRAKASLHSAPGGRWRTPLLTVDTIGDLTPREREVALLAAEHSSKDVARRLGLSTRTVDNYLGRAYAKLAVSNRTELRALLVAAGAIAYPTE